MASFLSRVPALPVLGAVTVTLCLCAKGLPAPAAVPAASFFIGGVLLLGEERWESRRVLFAVFLLTVAAALSSCAAVRIGRFPALPETVSGQFLVTGRRPLGHGEIMTLRSPDGRSWVTTLRKEFGSAREGEAYSLKASVCQFEDGEALGFSALRYWRSRGVLAELKNVRDVMRVKARPSLASFRQSMRERLGYLPPASRALICAVLLGDRDEQLTLHFRSWGISHFLAVSGWHVGLALFLGTVLFGLRRTGIFLCSAFIWAYCFLSGASLSALRASVMIQVAMIGRWAHLAPSSLNSVGVAGTLMLLWEPYAAFDIGWQLSVLATIVVLALFQRLKGLSALFVGPALWLLASPIAAPMSGGLFFSSIVINVMASLLLPFILTVVVLGCLPTLLGYGGTLFVLPGECLYRAWAVAADSVVAWLPMGLPVGFFPAWLCAGGVFLVLAFGLRFTWRRAVLLSAFGALSAVSLNAILHV